MEVMVWIAGAVVLLMAIVTVKDSKETREMYRRYDK